MTAHPFAITATRVVTAVLILFSAVPILAGTTWKSPDGAISIYLHDEWQKRLPGSTKIHNTKGSDMIVSGSQHRLFLGGFLARRYLSLQVAKYPADANHKIDELTGLVVARLRAQGLAVVQQFSDGRIKSWVLYRFLHSGDPVSQTMILVRAPETVYLLEMTAPRKDEERLRGESLQVFNSIKLQPAPRKVHELQLTRSIRDVVSQLLRAPQGASPVACSESFLANVKVLSRGVSGDGVIAHSSAYCATFVAGVGSALAAIDSKIPKDWEARRDNHWVRNEAGGVFKEWWVDVDLATRAGWLVEVLLGDNGNLAVLITHYERVAP